jgi:hypothetical protein
MTTGDQFIAGINITGDQYATEFLDIGDHSLSPVSLTTVIAKYLKFRTAS